MKIRLVFALICVLCGMSVLSCYGRDLHSDTWVAADALGRELPGYDECGTIRDDKTVGVFYFLWHDRAVNVRDVTKLLAENPFAPDWGSRWSWHIWGEPEMGYYRITDPYVLRRHASMLSDAGVDMVFFDVGNGVVYTEEYMNLCSVWQQMRDEGENTPQICFQVFTNPSLTVQRIYDELYSRDLYPDLWFRWKGKPLILAPLVPSDSSYSSEVLDFFTMRYSWAWTSGEDTWSWLDHYPQNWGWETDPLIPEQTSVCIAQHPAGFSIGRSFLASETRGAGVKPPLDDYKLTGTEDLGIYFEQQWQRALSIDPEILFITGWNEWIAQRFIAGLDGWPIFLGEQTADGDTYFVDQFNQEFSRDAEPMKGGHTDNYYYQMIEGIRKYKGVSQLVNNDQAVNVTIDGNFSEWESVESVYYDTYGDTIHRNHLGLNSITYTNTTGRNDIIESKVAFDAYNLYLYSKTAEKLTSNTDSNWMLLFINSDQDASTGWEGYDYVINRNRRDTLASLEKFMGNDWAPEPVGLISYSYSGNEIEIEIPRNLIDQDNKSNIAFDFHWADNIQTQGDIVEFSVSGDSAPNRRFNYRYQKSEPATHFNEDGEYEGWSLTNNLTNGSVFDGVLSCDIVGGDSYMINWTPFNVPASVYRYIHIRMKNQTSGGAAQVYWTTTTDTLMDNNKHKDFSIVAGDDEFTDYWLDMSSNEYWTGTIKFLRIDPSAATSGHIDIDFVRLQDSKPSCGDYGHDMSDMNRDCSVDLLDMAKLAEGWLRDVEVREELDVYVFAGQSNMYGLGLVSDLSSEYNTSFSQALIWFDGSWNVLSPDAGPYNGTRFGPEISFAYEMADLNPNRKFAIIKYAVGATNLYEQWSAPNGELYIELQNQVDAAINNLSVHYSPQIVGFMWMQGESDSHVLSTAQAYSQNLTDFITTLRSDLNLPNMPFYMGQISNCSYWTYYQTVNAGMVSVADTLANTGTFSTLDLTRWSSDPAHYDSAGQLELGRAIFQYLSGTLKMMKYINFFLLVVCGLFALESNARDLHSDTWVATDALGRELSGYDECGPVREDRTVGIFYFLWLNNPTWNVFNVTTTIAANPFDPPWVIQHYHFWDEPELGYYLNTDPYVLRKHASMLTDAGVDMVFFDLSNAPYYTTEYLTLCDVWQQMRNEGEATPQICFLLYNNYAPKVQTLYEDFYSQNLYPDLWFYWKGKPLILSPLSGLSQEVQDFFTIRHTWAWQTGGKWSWVDHCPQRYGWDTDPETPEQVSVCIAEHPTTNIGRSYHATQTWGVGSQPTYDEYKLTGTEDLGIYFNSQWEEALEIDPEILFVTGWNEWIAVRQVCGADSAVTFLGETLQEGDTFFVDQFNREYSRDAEPMKGGFTDNYYYQMIDGIRRYKGVSQPVNADEAINIAVDGDFGDWSGVAAAYYDTYGDTIHRDYAGWAGYHYHNTTGRNDIIESRVAFDAYKVCFYAKTAEKLTSNMDNNWMLLFINSDQDAATGWEGYDYVVNRRRRDDTASLEKFIDNEWSLENVGLVSYSYSGSEIEIAIPRNLIDQDNKKEIAFDFHWADNIQNYGDIMEFAVSGDSAPNRRFNYRHQKMTPATYFENEGDLEGWLFTNNLSNGIVSGDILSCDITGLDSYMINSTPYGVPASVYRYIHIRMKNQSSGKTAQVYWTTTTDVVMNESKHKDFAIVANDNEFRDYWLDMSGHAYWDGTIRLLRLDPSAAANGHIEIDFIRLQDRMPVCSDFGYDISDVNRDCAVDYFDMSVMALDWLD